MEIRMTDIRKIYRDASATVEALKGIDLAVKDGEMLSIMGSSGSGKSTLLYILACLDRATSGEYIAADKKITAMNNNEINSFRRGKIGMIYQNFALLPEYTVYENVELPLRIRGVDRHERKTIIMELLRDMEIDDLYKKRPDRLSGGQQQRCAIARALAAGNDLILADEPTGALDKATGIQVMEVLKRVNEQGRTVIVVTHDRSVAEYADRIVHIEDGRLLD